jgi:hypothetical protein
MPCSSVAEFVRAGFMMIFFFVVGILFITSFIYNKNSCYQAQEKDIALQRNLGHMPCGSCKIHRRNVIACTVAEHHRAPLRAQHESIEIAHLPLQVSPPKHIINRQNSLRVQITSIGPVSKVMIQIIPNFC